MKIKKLWGTQILDSRGFPTVQCNLLLDNDILIKSGVPSGASVGQQEALELRDGDDKKYFGKGVLQAIRNIDEKIAPIIVGFEPDFKIIDQKLLELDGTENKSNLGANAILAVSIAAVRAQAFCQKKELYKLIADEFGNNNIILPKVMFNILNGGVHADNKIPFQEFMIMPQKDNFSENLQMSVIVYQNLKRILKKEGYCTGVGDEGGFAPDIAANSSSVINRVLKFLQRAVDVSGFNLGNDVVFCLDVAASQFYNSEKKYYSLGDKKFSSDDIIEFYDSLVSDYPIFSIEDALDEQDWSGWQNLTEQLGKRIQLVGDDIFVTNTNLIKKGIEQKVANAVLIKPNQIGTVTETLAAIKLANDNNYKCVISHRSGETCDTFISDLVVGTGAGQLKAGAACRGERVAKYNRLLEIEESSYRRDSVL
ncbi:phosphopyruvate hydratase [Candidatus Dependentiae bacterium]|nr:phosphopyruvate hydratase [Candidatus Dependentiae bacterium]